MIVEAAAQHRTQPTAASFREAPRLMRSPDGLVGWQNLPGHTRPSAALLAYRA